MKFHKHRRVFHYSFASISSFSFELSLFIFCFFLFSLIIHQSFFIVNHFFVHFRLFLFRSITLLFKFKIFLHSDVLAKISFYQQANAFQHNIKAHNKNRRCYNATKNNYCKNLTHTIACNEKINLNIIKFNAIKNYLFKRYFD